jgi:hypothetical protein
MSWGQKSTSWINGEKYVTRIDVIFRVDVVNLGPNETSASVSAIKPEYNHLRSYLNKYGKGVRLVALSSRQWGDTLVVNPQGKVVKVPNLRKYIQIRFPKAVPAKKTLKELRSFPEIEKASPPTGFAY